MFARAWLLVNDRVQAFIDDGALSRGASIAFYASTSLGPVLLVVVAIAGLAFGEDAARGAVSAELSGLMGKPCTDLVQSVVQGGIGSFERHSRLRRGRRNSVRHRLQRLR
jgi:membrane protein